MNHDYLSVGVVVRLQKLWLLSHVEAVDPTNSDAIAWKCSRFHCWFSSRFKETTRCSTQDSQIWSGLVNPVPTNGSHSLSIDSDLGPLAVSTLEKWMTRFSNPWWNDSPKQIVDYVIYMFFFNCTSIKIGSVSEPGDPQPNPTQSVKETTWIIVESRKWLKKKHISLILQQVFADFLQFQRFCRLISLHFQWRCFASCFEDHYIMTPPESW